MSHCPAVGGERPIALRLDGDLMKRLDEVAAASRRPQDRME
jgi:predicted transcriptional regulator